VTSEEMGRGTGTDKDSGTVEQSGVKLGKGNGSQEGLVTVKETRGGC
jgi:hypothetical protein